MSLNARERRAGLLAAAIDDPANRIRRQLLLRQEPRRRAVGDRTREIGRRVGRDQDHSRPAIPVICGQPPGKLKPALTPEHDVYQDNLRPEFLCPPQRLSRGSGNTDHAQALLFQAIASGLHKQPVVVHNQDTEPRHVTSVPTCPMPRIGASRNRKSRALMQIRCRGRHRSGRQGHAGAARQSWQGRAGRGRGPRRYSDWQRRAVWRSVSASRLGDVAVLAAEPGGAVVADRESGAGLSARTLHRTAARWTAPTASARAPGRTLASPRSPALMMAQEWYATSRHSMAPACRASRR